MTVTGWLKSGVAACRKIGCDAACRRLRAELAGHHRRIYEDPAIGGDDPGSGFGDYLAVPERMASWMAEPGARVVGLAGLLGRGTSGEVEPVVVTGLFRGQASGGCSSNG